MIQIYLQSIHCNEETDEVGADEPYVLVTTVNLASSVPVGGFPVPLPAFDVVRYGFDDVDAGETHMAPGASVSFWGINGQLGGTLTDPDQVIFVVSLMENDNGDPEALRGVIKGIVGGSVLGSLTAPRPDKVAALLRDINSAMGTPTGAPNFDDKIGLKELRFTADELRRAENNEVVRRSLQIDGDGGRYELTFEARRIGWQADWFPLPGHSVFDHQRQRLAAVSRTADNLDLFVIGFDNRVWTTFWNNAGWHGDWFPLPGQAVFDHERQQIAAVSRAPGNLDLFVVGFDNRVWSTFWNSDTGWNGDWFPLPGQAVFDHQRQRVAAVSRASGNLDLFIVGFDNRVWTTFWNSGTGWNHDWFPLPGQAVFDHERQQVAAVSRAPGNLDLFIVGFDNRVWTTFWNNAGWNGDWFPLPGQAVFDHEHQQVAAVSRAPGNLDLFIVGFDNRVWTTFWNNAGWNGDWFPLPGQAVFDHISQRVAAVSRTPGNLDVFIVGFDNHIWTSFWPNVGGNWNDDFFALPGQAVFDRMNQQIAAVSRAPANLDLFIIGFDDRTWSQFWNG